ncbi:TonB-dependent receptor [Croceicoccus sp. YJ47]|uniref:TonB-dependent receptor n=1 Tax=Croceicoccus sp. YJ47 TaxID=2798724 RepID=UPI001F364D5B|nr:TonB-dependent receptor [Croceicoccus sp. YJ47]
MAAILPVSAMAQSSDAGDAADASVNSNSDRTIIVTATRRSESLLEVPVSVQAIGGEQLEQSGINNLSSLTQLAPSLQSGNDDTFSIRGIGTTTFSPTLEPTVSQVVDEVVYGTAAFAAAPFYDVERVEVLNGPQGLLFGKNASAGLVNIITTRPVPGEVSGYVNAEGVTRYRPGSNGLGGTVDGAINLPVGANSAVRLAGVYNEQDSVVQVIEKPAAGTRFEPVLKQYGGRAKWLSEIGDLTVYLQGDYLNSTGTAGFTDLTYRYLADGSTVEGAVAADGVTPGFDNLEAAADGPSFRDLEMGGVSANLSYDFANDWTVTSITAWRKLDTEFQFDTDFTTRNFLNTNANTTDYEQFSQEVRVALPDSGPFSGQVGVYYYSSDTHNTVLREGLNGLPPFVAVNFPFCVDAVVQPGPPPACSVSNSGFLGQDSDIRQSVRSSAVFGQFDYELVPDLTLSAGGRYTHDEVSIELTENTGNYFVTLGVPNNFTDEDIEADNFSWKLSADWQATPDVLVYGFYGRGYKGPGFSNSSPAPGASIAVEPEISKGGEIGIKGTALDRLLTFSLAAFYTKFQNLQVQAFNVPLQTFILDNAAEATTKGIDATVTLRPVSGLTVGANAAFLDASYDSYPSAQCYPQQTDPSCATDDFFDAAGLPVLLSADFTSTVFANYNVPLTNAIDGVLGGSWYHRSSYSTGFAPGQEVPTTDRFNANAGVTGDNWSLGIFCRNCFNQIRPSSVDQVPGDAASGILSYNQRFTIDSVRTVGLRAGFEF